MIYSFRDFELDEERFEFRARNGGRVEVQPKVLQLLLHLVRNRAQVVSKQAILEALWPDAAVTEGSLARAVSLARAAIDDRGKGPHAIVTVARRGYRFEAPVRETPSAGRSRSPAVEPSEDGASRYIGRAALLARLEERLDGALAGNGRILFLAGEAGIGKTRTAELLVERARQAGATVATAFGLEDGAASHWSWTRLLRTLAAREPSALALLAPAQRACLSRLAPELGPEPEVPGGRWRGDEAERSALFEAVDALLAAALRARPLALFLDDLHGADAESIALLEFVGQSLAERPLAIVVTCREEDAGGTPRQARAIERLLRSTALERWPLAALTADELREFVHARLGREADPELLEVLARQTGGNPLWIGESLRSLEARSLLAEARPAHEWEALLPRGIRHLLLPKLRRLSAGAGEALAFAAALGREIDLPLLAESLPDAARLDERLGEAVDATLLLPASAPGHAPRFAHALVREALYDELLPAGERRSAVHARISAALEKTTQPDDALSTRAHHACEGVPRVPAAGAIELARRAGAQAARRHDFERAVHWYERALATLPFLPRGDPALSATLQLGLGDAQTRALGLERARVSYREAADHARSIGRGDQLVQAALGFAHRPSSTGSADAEAIRLLDEAQRSVPAGDEALRIRVLSRLAVELRYDEAARAEALMDEAIAAARRFGDPAVLARTLDDSSFVRFGPADSEGWIALNVEITEAATAGDDLELVLSGQRGLVTGWLELGDRAGVEREVRACERTADALRTPHARWFCAALRAMVALLAGDLGAAERRVGEAVALGDRLDSREVALELGTPLVYLRFEQGRAAEIEAAVRAQVERFPDAAAWRAALARLLLAAGRRAEARSELERLGRARFTDVPRDRGYLPTLAMCAEVAHAIGDERAASYLEPRLAPYARLHISAGSGLLHYGTVAYALGLVAAARSRWDAAVAHFERALAAEERMGAQLWAARTRLAGARALLARGAPRDRPQAARLARAALRAARRQAWHEVAAAGGDLETALWTTRAPTPPAASRGARKGSES